MLSGPERARSRRRWPGLVALLVVLSACTPHPVGPARTSESFEGKARTTAESALSSVETVRLVAQTAAAGDAFGPYVSQVLSGQEGAVDGLAGTFGSIQPPDERSDALRSELLDLIDTALDHVTDVRIAARRGELRGLDAIARPLDDDAAALEAFLEAHGG